MGVRENIQADIEKLQSKLAKLDRVGEDKFYLGTVMIFSLANGKKFYIVKAEEEGWYSIKSGETKSLPEWIFSFEDAKVGDFEVYELVPKANPFYAGGNS